MRYKDLSGQKFGRITVLSYAYTSIWQQAMFMCLCDCGTTKIIRGSQLSSGNTRSCGCLHKEISQNVMKKVNASGFRCVTSSTRHGGHGSKLNMAWQRMRSRCHSVNADHYKHYGGRGIGICKEWDDYATFREWAISTGYDGTREIDRIDNDGDYCPENCRWATRTEQMRNRRNTVKISHEGVTKPLADWCDDYGIKYKLAHARYKKGYTFERIFLLQDLTTAQLSGNVGAVE